MTGFHTLTLQVVDFHITVSQSGAVYNSIYADALGRFKILTPTIEAEDQEDRALNFGCCTDITTAVYLTNDVLCRLNPAKLALK